MASWKMYNFFGPPCIIENVTDMKNPTDDSKLGRHKMFFPPNLLAWCCRNTHTHTHPFNDYLSGTIQVSRYQKGKINLDFTKARDSEWQWHQLGHMQVCTSLQTELSFLQAGCPSCRPTNSAKALKACAAETRHKSRRWWQELCSRMCVYQCIHTTQYAAVISLSPSVSAKQPS